MRDNCVDKNFYHRPYKCGVLPHLAQPSFATPPPLFILQPLKLATSNLLYNLCFGE